jgi:hypothetical protein
MGFFSNMTDDLIGRLRSEVGKSATDAVRTGLERANKRLTPVLIASVVIWTGGALCLVGITFALAEAIPFWASALVVGGGTLAVGLHLLRRARRSSADPPG